jgi:hypothetical protein
LIEKKYLLNPYNNLSPDVLNQTKVLGQEFIKNMPKPPMCKNCKEGENYYMKNGLNYYACCKLDSIAYAAYKKQVTLQKELYTK